MPGVLRIAARDRNDRIYDGNAHGGIDNSFPPFLFASWAMLSHEPTSAYASIRLSSVTLSESISAVKSPW